MYNKLSDAHRRYNVKHITVLIAPRIIMYSILSIALYVIMYSIMLFLNRPKNSNLFMSKRRILFSIA